MVFVSPDHFKLALFWVRDPNPRGNESQDVLSRGFSMVEDFPWVRLEKRRIGGNFWLPEIP